MGREFYNNSFKKWLKDNDIGIYSTHNEGKSVVAERSLEFDKLDIDKLVPVPADLNKLNDVVKNDAVKRDVYNKLVTKVDNIDTSRFILKFKYDTDKSELEKKFLILVI